MFCTLLLHLSPSPFPWSYLSSLHTAGSKPTAYQLLGWSNSRTILLSCHEIIPGSKCCLCFCKRLVENLQEVGVLLWHTCTAAQCWGQNFVQQKHQDGTAGLILGSWTARDTMKSLSSMRPWSRSFAGLVPGLHALAGHLPSGGESESPSTGPNEGPLRAHPGTSCCLTVLCIHQGYCCKKGVSWASREGLDGRVLPLWCQLN